MEADTKLGEYWDYRERKIGGRYPRSEWRIIFRDRSGGPGIICHSEKVALHIIRTHNESLDQLESDREDEERDRPCGCPPDYHMADCEILTSRYDAPDALLDMEMADRLMGGGDFDGP